MGEGNPDTRGGGEPRPLPLWDAAILELAGRVPALVATHSTASWVPLLAKRLNQRALHAQLLQMGSLRHTATRHFIRASCGLPREPWLGNLAPGCAVQRGGRWPRVAIYV